MIPKGYAVIKTMQAGQKPNASKTILKSLVEQGYIKHIPSEDTEGHYLLTPAGEDVA